MVKSLSKSVFNDYDYSPMSCLVGHGGIVGGAADEHGTVQDEPLDPLFV